MKRSLLISLLVLSCSSPTAVAPTPSAEQTLARVARFPELRLRPDGALERAVDGVHLARTDWKLVGGLDVTLSDATRIALDETAWIELSTSDRRSSGTVSGAAFVLSDVAPATDVVHQVNRTRYEEVRVLRDPRAPTTTRYRVRLGPGLASLRVVDDRVEVLDASGRVRLESAAPFALDDRGERRAVHVRLVGDVLETTLDPEGLTYPIVVDPLWTPTPDMAITRHRHGAAPLPDGKVMIAGGLRSTGSATQTNTVIAWDPATNAFTSLSTLSSGQADSFVLTVLSSGRILKTGGNDGTTPSRNSYVYDPTASSWGGSVYMGAMPYVADVVAALASDQALAVSGPDALLYDRAAGTWVTAGTPTVSHSGQTATTISGNRVIVIGGSNVVDLWDPTTKTFSAGGTLGTSRSNHTATLLPSGKVLLVGGTGLSTAELYDPATKTSTAAGTMAAVRTSHTATLLGDRVLVVGGQNGTGVLSTAEIWDPASNTFKPTASMSVPRVLHTATASGGKVLVVGGWNGTSVHSTAEVFQAYAKGATCAAATDCASGFCVDGVCCDKACDGQCEACDATGSVGTCSAVTGAPHGARTACTGGTGVCAKTCDGVDRTQCTFPGATVVCSPATCAAGTASTATSCDGAGACPTPTKSDCGPYACGDSACKTACTGDGDCGGANVCDTKTGKCVVAAEAKCAPDRGSSIPTDTSKPAVPCSPYLCDTTTGKCSTRCVSSADCVGGTACDTASGACLPPKTDTPTPGDTGGDDSGGCATGHGSASGSLVLLLAMLGLRRRQQK